MRKVLFVLALAGCAAQTPDPVSDSGQIVGEVGDPRNRARLHTELASLYYSAGNLGVALEELRAASAADSGYAPTHGMYGLVYMSMNDNTRAEESFERALRISPNDADINHNYGWFLCQTKREPQSIKYFLAAIRNPLYPSPWRSYSAAGVCTLKTDAKSKDAEAFFERALRISPNDADINHNYGWFLCQTKREPQSIKYFLAAIRNPLYPSPWRSYSAAGVCTLRTDAKSKDAEAFFERALRLEPDEPTALLSLGQIRYNQGNVGEARRLVTRYNKLVTPSAESLWLAVRIERKLGERLQEQAFANQLRRRYPGSPEYQALQRGQYD